jgi:hypothetical protein
MVEAIRLQRRSSEVAIDRLQSALDEVRHSVHEEVNEAYARLHRERLLFEEERSAFEKERSRLKMANSAAVFFDLSPEVFRHLRGFLHDLQITASEEIGTRPEIPINTVGECSEVLYCRCSPQAWNPCDKGEAVIIGDDRHVSSRYTPWHNSLIRGKVGYVHGKHYFKIKTVQTSGGESGNHVLGVATEDAPLEFEDGSPGEHFWGLSSQRNMRIHGRSASELVDELGGHEAGTDYGFMLDMDNRTLSSTVNGHCLGVIFSDLPKRKLYPALGVGAMNGCIYKATFNCMWPVGLLPSPAPPSSDSEAD